MKKLNICFTGESNAGKTHLIYNILGNHTIPYVSTVGVGMDIDIKIIDNVKVYIWDYSYNRYLDKYIRHYHNNIDVYIIVVDCENWEHLKNISKNIADLNGMPYEIFINRIDKLENRLYKNDLIEFLNTNYRDNYFLTSCYNLENLLVDIRYIVQKYT